MQQSQYHFPNLELATDLGTSDVETLRRFLLYTEFELLQHAQNRRLSDIVISSAGKSAPITLYDRNAQGRYQMRLNEQGRSWCSYVYQFSHELTHILCNYELKNTGDKQWFEEAICDAASLFVCKRVFAKISQLDDPVWKAYGNECRNWLNAMLDEPNRKLRSQYSLAAWYDEKATALRTERVLTDNSKLVSAYLLPLFEDDPSGWQSLKWINTEKEDADVPFREYLARWSARCPKEHQSFVLRIRRLLDSATP